MVHVEGGPGWLAIQEAGSMHLPFHFERKLFATLSLLTLP